MAVSDQNSVDALIAQVQQDAAAAATDAGAAGEASRTDAAPTVDGAAMPSDAAAAVDQAAAQAADLVNEIAGEMEPPGTAAAAPTPAAGPLTPHAETSQPAGTNDVSRLLAIEVPVIVQLGMRRLTVGEVMRLAVGAIVEFGKSAEEELDLLINNKAVGKGQAVKVGENFGIKVTTIGSVKETIKKLGG